MRLIEFRAMLETKMKRSYSDNSARTIRIKLQEAGWNESEYVQVLDYLSDRNMSGGRITVIPTKTEIDYASQQKNRYRGMIAINFINEVNEHLGEDAPKNRKHKNGKEYPSTQWNRWFSDCYLSLNIRGVYEPEQYVRVLEIIKRWKLKKDKLKKKKLSQQYN